MSSTTDVIIAHLYSRTHLVNDRLDSVRDGPNTKLLFCRDMMKDINEALNQLEGMLNSSVDRKTELNAIAEAVHTMTKNELVEHIKGLI